jgi:hypothetical protein
MNKITYGYRSPISCNQETPSAYRRDIDHRCEANAHMERMLQDSPTLSYELDLMAKTYSPAELKILR